MTMEFRYSKLFTLGLGFFVITLTWALYNAFIPIFLQRYISSGLFVGFLMTFDNIAAITLQPFFGAKSDGTTSRFGRRMPYLLIGIPISALCFALLPIGYAAGFSLLIVSILFFNTAMSIYRAPTVALMPDLTPAPLRSKANGIINLMGGLGGVLAFFVGAKMYEIDYRLPFVASAVLMLSVVVVLYFSVREPKRAREVEAEKVMGIVEALTFIFREKDKSALFLLLAILFWFTGFGAIETFFTSYGEFYLGVGAAPAAFAMGFFSISFLVFAIPSGILATKIGRKSTILWGLGGLLAIFVSLIFISDMSIIRVLLLFAGLFWAFVNINSYPMVVEMTTENNIGAYTGLYYFYSSMAAIIGPTLFGYIKDLLSYKALFPYSITCLVLAILCMVFVRKGEVAKKTTTVVGS